MDLTQESILSLLLENGGKLKNSELLNNFKGLLNSAGPTERKQNRDLFKTFVNTIAVVKEIDEVKCIVLKKKYHHLLKRPPDSNGEGCDSKLVSECIAPTQSPKVEEKTEDSRSHDVKSEASESDKPESSSHSSIDEETSHTTERQSVIEEALQRTVDLKPKRTLIFTQPLATDSDFSVRKTAASQPKPVALPLRIQPVSITQNAKFGKGHSESVSEELDAHGSPRSKRRPFANLTCSSPPTRRHCKNDNPIDEPKYSGTFPLDAAEHELMVRSAAGHWSQVHGLLLQDSQLAEKRDFISGFTALHWAAKSGNSEMIRNIISLSRHGGKEVDINARAFGGYTPLHIAAIHGQEYVIQLLVCQYDAINSIRDNCGKKPYHYLPKGVAPKTRELLGQPLEVPSLHQNEEPQDKEDMDLHRHLHSISKLFHGHSTLGHRKKQKPRTASLFLAEESERDESPSLHRIFSDVFS